MTEDNIEHSNTADTVLPGRKRPMLPLERYPFDPSHHKVISPAHAGVCSWHGKGCDTAPVWSYRTPMGMVSACARGAAQIENRYGPPQESLQESVEGDEAADEKNGGKKEDHDDE